MDHRQAEGGIARLLGERRQDVHPLVPEAERGFADRAVLRSQLDAVLPRNRNTGHYAGDRAAPITGQPIDTGAHQKMRACLARDAEELIDVILSVANIDAAPRVTEQRAGLLQARQPADTLLLLDRHPRRVDMALQLACVMERL